MEKIKKLRKALIRENIDGYIIPKNDEFFGEYVSSHNDRLKYISNFSGSYGLSLILKNQNYLFVDGRYTLQAINQSGKFFKVLTFPNKMPADILKNRKLTIGFDPTLLTKKVLNVFFKKNNCKFKPLKNNLIDEIWDRKIKKSMTKFYCLPNHSVGLNYKSKIQKVVNFLKKKNADFQFITASENNAWLLNIRGKDTKYSPLPHCHILIEKNKKMIFFCDLKKIPLSFKKNFSNVNFIKFNLINKILAKIKKKKIFNRCKYMLFLFRRYYFKK